MSSWADMSDDHPPRQHYQQSSGGPPPTRKRLQLKPRSATKKHDASSASASSGKSNPFGAAKPREEVLASKGIDAKSIDEKIQKKATVLHFTKDQDAEIQAIQAELTKAESDLRNANEQELPEEKYRVKVEKLRKELNELTAKYTAENAEKAKAKAEAAVAEGKEGHHFERPSERRRRLDEQAGKRTPHGNEDGDAFANFGGRRRGGHDDHYE
mmetsp:Transcript_14590/g.20621  ORF Transcript_14590/g.20621 Transcript_14590/m.20621 type:complete len:213 (-) Transcript_14590:48-686(-)